MPLLSLCFSIAQVRMSTSCSSIVHYHGLGFLFRFGLLQCPFVVHYHGLGFLFRFGLLQCPFVVHHCVIAMQISMISNGYTPNTNQILGEKTMVGM